MRFKTLFILLVLVLLSGKITAQTNPVTIFNEVWNAYDTLYSGFAHKDIDWNKLYDIYRYKVNSTTSESDLFQIITDMLRHLNDNHVQISKNDPNRHFSAGLIGYIIDDIGLDSTINLFTTKPVSEEYFKRGLNSLNKFSFGWIEDSIGYLHFSEFRNIEETKQNMDSIINYFSSSKAIIVDVRRNTGGNETVVKAVADYFADEKRKYMITSYKNGPGHNDFTEKKVWFTEPSKSFNYLNPVFLLIDNTSFSGAETFSWAMREIPHVTLVGDHTSGAYADSEWITLPCGWNVCIPYSLHTDKNGFCWEGIGVPPDYYIKTNPTIPVTDKDQLIEFTINLIKN